MATREQLIHEDIKRLHAMGYAQELFRAMGGFSNFAISFTIISVLSGCLTSFFLGLGWSGPAASAFGWPIVAAFTLLVALSMAEIASSYPTSGGLYFWASKLGGATWGWYTGWINLIGLIGIVAAVDYGLATFANILMNQWWGVSQSAQAIMLTFTVFLVLHLLMNSLGVRLVALLNDISVWWHIAVVALFVLFLAVKAPVHSLSTAFHTGFTTTGFPYWYSFLLGFLLAQYTITGFDASAHMSEETIGANTRAPWGIVLSVVISAFAGYALLMALMAAIPSISSDTIAGLNTGVLAKGDPCTLKATAGAVDCQLTALASNTNAVGLILNGALGENLGTLLLLLAVIAQFYCGMSCVTSASRMVYAFSRDGAMPLSNVWHTLNRATRTPINAIVLVGVLGWLLAATSFFSSVAYAAATSIGVIGLFLSYIIPVFLRRRLGQGFQRGVWHLGTWSSIINVVAIAWVAFICVLFMLPTATPITSGNFNYTPVVVLGTLTLLTIWYVTSVRFWFKGPRVQGDSARLAQIEHDLGESVEISLA